MFDIVQHIFPGLYTPLEAYACSAFVIGQIDALPITAECLEIASYQDLYLS